jgi:heat shock protein HtpX
MNRYFLLFATNLIIVLVLSIIMTILGIDSGTWFGMAILCLIFGLGGAFINLQISVWMAKKWYGVQVINENSDKIHQKQDFLFNKCIELCKKAGTEPAQIGIYNSNDVNAFATGPSSKKSLLAFSSGLLNQMNEDEIEGVIAHEIGHVVSGDMVTMTLLQGIMNAFVMFAARAVATVIDNYIDDKDGDDGWGLSIWGYWILVWVLEIVFMFFAYILLSWVSRKREYAADAYSAQLVGREKMIAALRSLDKPLQIEEKSERDSMVFSKINNSKKVYLFETHPHIEDRIQALLK